MLLVNVSHVTAHPQTLLRQGLHSLVYYRTVPIKPLVTSADPDLIWVYAGCKYMYEAVGFRMMSHIQYSLSMSGQNFLDRDLCITMHIASSAHRNSPKATVTLALQRRTISCDV